MDIAIREAGPKDMGMIWKATMETVWSDLPEDERAQVDRATFEKHFRPHAETVVESDENVIFVAESSGSLLGYAIVGGASTMLSPVPFGFLYDLWVAPDARRQGVGRRLLERSERWCRGRGYTRMKLEVAATNASARALYASDGFGEERIFMGRRL